MRVAFIGCGEVGLLYAKAIAAAGHALTMCDLRPSAAAVEFSQQANVPLHHVLGDWLAGQDVAISCVDGSVSLAVACQALPAMQSGAHFIDMTTCDPENIRVAAAEAATLKIVYSDVAILGAVALSGIKTNLLCAGTGALAAADLFGSLGASIRVLADGRAGDAAALKILRSVFTKGMEALTVECFLAAEQQGVTEKLHDALSDIDQACLRDFLEALVRTHVIHAQRRLKEVEEAERQLRKAGLAVDVLPGVRARFARTSERIVTNPIQSSNPSIAEAFAWLSEANDQVISS